MAGWDCRLPLAAGTATPAEGLVRVTKKTTQKKAAKRIPPRASKKRLTVKQAKFVEGVARGKSGSKAARDAGYSEKTARVIASENLTKPSISEAVEKRRAEAMRRAQINTDVIIGSLAEIATASLGDVLDDEGNFDIQIARVNGVDHLLKKVVRTVRHSKDGSSRTTYEYEMYSRLDALHQLRDTFGMKEEQRSNTLEERRRKEVERSIHTIMERDKVNQPTAARKLIAELGNAPQLIQIAETYVQ